VKMGSGFLVFAMLNGEQLSGCFELQKYNKLSDIEMY